MNTKTAAALLADTLTRVQLSGRLYFSTHCSLNPTGAQT